MIGRAPVKATGWDVSGWGQSEGGLRHQWAMHRRTRRCRRGGGVVCGAGAGGVLEEARLGLRELKFGKNV